MNKKYTTKDFSSLGDLIKSIYKPTIESEYEDVVVNENNNIVLNSHVSIKNNDNEIGSLIDGKKD